MVIGVGVGITTDEVKTVGVVLVEGDFVVTIK
jgi:hypothetical protein